MVKTAKGEKVHQYQSSWNKKRAVEMESQRKQQKVRVQRMIVMMEMMVKNERRRGNLSEMQWQQEKPSSKSELTSYSRSC